MARTRDQFRQSDVTTWGVVALVCGGIALLTANVSAVIPDSVFAALHATRLGGATVNEMHSELTNVEDAQARFRATASELVSRLDTSERDSTIVRQRIAALEVSVPQLTEALNTRRPAGIDPSLVTGSIDAPAQSFGKPGTPAATVPAARSTASGNASAPAVSSAPVQSMPAPLPAPSGRSRGRRRQGARGRPLARRRFGGKTLPQHPAGRPQLHPDALCRQPGATRRCWPIGPTTGISVSAVPEAAPE